jgi:hypothetical protein
MKTPEKSTVLSELGVEDTPEVAGRYITDMDYEFNREDVIKIAEWIHYLSTQD